MLKAEYDKPAAHAHLQMTAMCCTNLHWAQLALRVWGLRNSIEVNKYFSKKARKRAKLYDLSKSHDRLFSIHRVLFAVLRISHPTFMNPWSAIRHNTVNYFDSR